MRKRISIVIGVLLALGLGWFIWIASQPEEPSYQGKRLSIWLEDYENWGGDTNNAASVAFREMGTNAIPPLLHIIESGVPPMHRMINWFNRKQSMVQIPSGEPWHRPLAASYALYSLGTNARPAFPTLTNLLFQSNERIASAIALAGIGSEAVPTLIDALTNQNERIQGAAILGLEYEHNDLKIVVSALAARLKDKSQIIRGEAVITLGQLCAEPDIAVPALTKDYPGKDKLYRILILQSLGRFGNKANEAIPLLLGALKDNDQDVRDVAASALKQVDPAAAAKAGVK